MSSLSGTTAENMISGTEWLKKEVPHFLKSKMRHFSFLPQKREKNDKNFE